MSALVRQWEYQRIELTLFDVAKPAFEERLNALGGEGWELTMGLQHLHHGSPKHLYLILKRPKGL
jgi:Domain of unknown function (DUF4177)